MECKGLKSLWLAAATFPVLWFSCGAVHAEIQPISAADYAEIQHLYARYQLAVDMGDGETRRNTFVEGGTFHGSLSEEPETVDEIVARTSGNGVSGARHMTYNIVVNPTEEGAKGYAYMMVLSGVGEPDEKGFIKATTGMYEDTLVRTDQGWKFKTRKVWRDTRDDSPFQPGKASPFK